MMQINAPARQTAYPFPPDPMAEDWRMVTRRTLIGLGLAGGALALGGGAVGLAYARAIGAARDRIAQADRRFVPTRFGTLEYAEEGAGPPPLLMVHGSGGGFDQGLLFGRGLAAAGYRIVAPSRFGYLGSDMPADPSPENQADAFIELLDALDIERVAIAGLSAGALSALAFAIAHPDRCAALIPIVPAAYAPGREEGATVWSPLQEAAVNAVLGSDLLFWSAMSLAPDFITGSVLATDPALVSALGAGEAVAEVRRAILPISARAEGLLNDMRRSAAPPRMALETIAAPTLALSAEDDRYETAEAARFIAATVPGAEAIVFPDGGHLLVGHEAALAEAIDAFLKEIGYA